MVLTPKEVHDTPSYTLAMLNSGQWPLEGEYIPDSVYARLEQSHEELRQQLAEALREAGLWREAHDRVSHQVDQAQAEVVRLREALKQALDEYEAYLEETKEMARRHPELLHEPHDDDWAVLLRLRALLAATSPAVESLERRLKAADELAEASEEVDQHAPLAPVWAYNLRRKLVAYRAASGRE